VMHRRNRARFALRSRPLKPVIDRLERRELLASGVLLSPMYKAIPYFSQNPPAGAFTPSQIATAYGFNKLSFNGVKGDGTGETIAIVDAQDDPNIQADLNVFDQQFSLPAITVNRVSQTGSTSYPATDSTGGWELEESLDVEWAHAIAPGAKIMLVEAASAYDSDLLTAIDYAAAHANVISMSWGGGEFSGQKSEDIHLSHPGVTFVASSGDSGAPISWPASSPSVLAVGGTSLFTGPGSSWSSESGWNGSGGGPSAFESKPGYQASVSQSTTRANPDVAYDADPNTGFAIYDTFAYNGSNLGWLQIGGTSAGAPQWAALIAIADQGRTANSLPALDATSSQEVMTILYKNSAAFHDITKGTSGGTPNYSASVGYDYVTGLGSPKADLVVPILVGVAPANVDHFVLAAPASDVAGTALNVTVTATTSTGAVDPSYAGTVKFSSTDTQAGLPANYTFTTADHGVHTFAVTLKTAASQSVTATDIATGQTSGTVSGIVVSPAAASQLLISGLSSTATIGSAQSFTITAKDPFGNLATGYVGTVSFSSSDGGAALPGAYGFLVSDKGSHTFSVMFGTVGTQSLTAADASHLTVTQTGIAVSPMAPINLGATVISTSQINLAWSAAQGATGYSVERSANGSTGWAQVGTTTVGTTTFSNTGLSAGTLYYYRVRATAGSSNSAYSNMVNATTKSNSTTGSSDTIWSNSYQPQIDSYASGNYELGVKFTSDVSGNVTGARFFKQTWMNGFSHVGHLWSSSGALLATAAFTSETASGWEQVNFATPVSISANTTYTISFSSGGGYFGINSTFFANAGVDNAPLHALSNGVSGGDGVYNSGGRFPSVGSGGMNFWADVAFSPTSTAHAIVGPTGGQTTVATANVVAHVSPATDTANQVAPPKTDGAVVNTTTQTNRVQTHQSAAVVNTWGDWPYRRAVAQTWAFSTKPKGLGWD
jgi:hypothetical protein